MSRPTILELPAPGSTTPTPVQTSGPVVIVGANGSGKTRLGSWLEFNGPQAQNVHRVGAQKSLQFPNSASPIAMADAEISLLYGLDYGSVRYYKENPNDRQTYKRSSRWGENPDTQALNDYDKLLTYLVSEEYEVSLAYRTAAKEPKGRIAPTDTKLDTIKRIWEEIFSSRELLIKAGTIEVRSRTDSSNKAYQASKMSDGERVGFYLIGQCLSTRADSIIVVDEPEVHLHRVIQSRLWDAIERERLDCLLVYLTHDLDFAASRTNAKKLWIEEYNGATWNWQEVPETDDLPEEILLALLGSREPVIFVEGDKGSLDFALYSHIYPERTIIPRVGCEQVISATTAFTSLKAQHKIECQGIIDRDFRSADDVRRLLPSGIHVLDVQEAENLLLVEDVLLAVANHASHSGLLSVSVETTVQNIKQMVFQKLEREKAQKASKAAAWKIEKALRHFNTKAQGPEALAQALTAVTSGINTAAIYAEELQKLEVALQQQNYAEVLRLYNNKGLVAEAAPHLGLAHGTYVSFIKNLVGLEQGKEILAALKAAAPVLPTSTMPSAIQRVVSTEAAASDNTDVVTETTTQPL